jgi:hypothetical protein
MFFAIHPITKQKVSEFRIVEQNILYIIPELIVQLLNQIVKSMRVFIQRDKENAILVKKQVLDNLTWFT